MKLIDKIVKKIKLHDIKMQTRRVEENFQIAELNGEIWLTFVDCPIMPCSMLKEEPIKALLEIRKLHILNKTSDYGD